MKPKKNSPSNHVFVFTGRTENVPFSWGISGFRALSANFLCQHPVCSHKKYMNCFKITFCFAFCLSVPTCFQRHSFKEFFESYGPMVACSLWVFSVRFSRGVACSLWVFSVRFSRGVACSLWVFSVRFSRGFTPCAIASAN